jgi:hypothetical protein
MSQLIQIDERKIVSMDEISEDGYWQSIDGEWIPTEKQLEAINNGAIPHDNVIVNQGGRESLPDTFTHQVEEISSESKTLELNKCAACDNHFEGSEARKCPTKKCNNPICLNCDPLETTMSKTKDAVVLVAQLATLSFVSVIGNELGKRIKCSDCMRNSRKQDRLIMSVGVSLFIAFWGIALIDFGIVGQGIIIFPVLFISNYLLSQKVLKELYYPVNPKFSNGMINGIILASVIIFVLIFVVWFAFAMPETNDQHDEELIGNWYNPAETLQFYEDGRILNTENSMEEWRTEGMDLILVFKDDSEYEYYYRYQISTPFVFAAPYEDANMTSISADDCTIHSSNPNATEDSYWENIEIKTPTWCSPS